MMRINMDIRDYNRAAWDRQVESRNCWTIPVSSEKVARARSGDWEIVLTPARPVPRPWFGELDKANVLCLASGGGQQGPILAAAGADVVVFDNSPAQLAQDRFVAERDGLRIETIEGDMRDLSCLEDRSFDLIVHPCSNSFVPDVAPVWREAFRVLRSGGCLLSGFCNPVLFVFDYQQMKSGCLVVRHKVPYSDLKDLTKAELQELMDEGEPLCFGHSLADQIGGQIAAGFGITGFYEDRWSDDQDHASISQYLPAFVATRGAKPA